MGPWDQIGYARDSANNNPKLRKRTPEDSWLPRRWDSFVYGAEEQGARFLRHAGEALDFAADLERIQAASTGTFFDPIHDTVTGGYSPIQVPDGVRASFIKPFDQVGLKATAPIAARLSESAKHHSPAHPTKGDQLLRNAGAAAVGLPTFVFPPAAIAYYGIDGYGSSYEDALSHGAKESQAQAAGLENGTAQSAISAVPIPGGRSVAAALLRGIETPLARRVLNTSVGGGFGMLYGASSQATANGVAKENYDPKRSLSDGVPQATTMAGLFGALGGAASLRPTTSTPAQAKAGPHDSANPQLDGANTDESGLQPPNPLDDFSHPADQDDLTSESYPPHQSQFEAVENRKGSQNTTRLGVKRRKDRAWRALVEHWDRHGYGDALSNENRIAIQNGISPRVDDAWINMFPEDAGLTGEVIEMHHIGGNLIQIPWPWTRHRNAHMPGGTKFNPGGPGEATPYYPAAKD